MCLLDGIGWTTLLDRPKVVAGTAANDHYRDLNMIRHYYLYADDNLLRKLACGRVEFPYDILNK